MADFGIMPDKVFSINIEITKNCSVSRISNNAELNEIRIQTSCKENAPVQSHQKVLLLFSLVPKFTTEL